MHHFIVHVVSLLSLFLLITNRKQRSFNPLLKTRRAYTWTSSLREQTRDSDQSTSAKFCRPLIMRETKRESLEARSGYGITAQGVFGDERRTKTETEREQSNAGEFPKTLTPSKHRIMHTLNLKYDSLYLLLNTFSSRPFFDSQFYNSYRTHFFLSFLAVQYRTFLEPHFQSKYLHD